MEFWDIDDKNGMYPIFVNWDGNNVKLTWLLRMKINKSKWSYLIYIRNKVSKWEPG